MPTSRVEVGVRFDHQTPPENRDRPLKYLPACENSKCMYNTQQQKKHSRGAGLRRRQSAAWGKRKRESGIRVR